MTYDDELIIRAQQGDTEALNVLCMHWRDFVKTICVKYFYPDTDTAEDAVQTSLIRVTQNIASFRCGSKFSTWLYIVTQRVCHDISAKRVPVAPEGITDEPVSNKDFVKHVENCVVLDQVLARLKAELTPQSYEIFITTYKLEMTAVEISNLIGIAPDAVRQRLTRIRKVVREIADVTDWGVGDV